VEEELKNSGVWGIQMESAGLRKDGSIFPTEVSLRVMPVGGERFRLLVQIQGEGIGIVDFEERFVFANPAGEEIFGTPTGGLVGRRLEEFTDLEEYLALREETWKRMYGAKGSYEMTITRADGEKRILQVTAVPWLDKERNFSGTFGIFRDITERKRAEEEEYL
jgi:PAS domain S-box-containing protein